MLQTELNRRRVMSGDANPPYIMFTSDGDISLSRQSKINEGIIEYSTNKKTWNIWTTSVINANKVLYLRGKGNTKLSDYSSSWNVGSPNSVVYCKGDIRNLLNYEDVENITPSNNCFQRLFYNCKKLITPPSLPIKNLTPVCYTGMFEGCSSLQIAPDLPAVILTENCYANMFNGCTSLKQAPILRAEVLKRYAYANMFNGCSQIDKITMLATDISEEHCLDNWVNGVSVNGTFIKNPAMTTLPTGTSGIPSGWTVEDYVG